jgi:hypothetical protein
MTPLESRKQLLLAESELNRAGLGEDMAELTADVRALAARARSFRSIATTVAVLVAGVAALRRKRSVEAEPKPFWLQTILKGGGLVSTLWSAFRSRGGDGENTSPNPRD